MQSLHIGVLGRPGPHPQQRGCAVTPGTVVPTRYDCAGSPNRHEHAFLGTLAAKHVWVLRTTQLLLAVKFCAGFLIKAISYDGRQWLLLEPLLHPMP